MTDGRPHPDMDIQAIVLLPDAASADAEAIRTTVRQIAAERGWLIAWQDDPHIAFAEICLHHKLRMTRDAWGMDAEDTDAPPRALHLILTPQLGSAAAQQLIAAAELYAPSVGISVVQGDTIEDIVIPVYDTREPGDGDNIDLTPRGPLPPLRLADAIPGSTGKPMHGGMMWSGCIQQPDMDDDNDGDDDETPPADDPSRITEEEIEMLFEPPPPRDQAGGTTP